MKQKDLKEILKKCDEFRGFIKGTGLPFNIEVTLSDIPKSIIPNWMDISLSKDTTGKRPWRDFCKTTYALGSGTVTLWLDENK